MAAPPSKTSAVAKELKAVLGAIESDAAKVIQTVAVVAPEVSTIIHDIIAVWEGTKQWSEPPANHTELVARNEVEYTALQSVRDAQKQQHLAHVRSLSKTLKKR
jgi:hypothetical protein